MRAYRRPPLDHLLAMTDDVGLLQHAVLDVPNRSCGYCTDDVGRALIVACDAAALGGTEFDEARLVTTYLAYLHDAQRPDGWFHDFMGYDRRWQDDAGTEDAVGRAIWGLGYAERHADRPTWRTVASRIRRRAHDAICRLTYPRARAYAALGLAHALTVQLDEILVFGDMSPAWPCDEPELRSLLDRTLAPIADAFDTCATPEWQWCEDVLTYDNARICEALIRGGAVLANERYAAIGLAMLRFYCSVVLEDDPASGETIFVPVGNDGWYPRGGVKSRNGQQPLEAAALVEAALAAFDATGDAFWTTVAETAHAWYLGRNSYGLAVATETGCRDGVGDGGVNPNMGAESTVCYLMSAIALAKRSARPLRVAR
jgi:hypothetical protein